MASVSNSLPAIFRWVFTVLAGLMALAAFAILVVIFINPHLPSGLDLGPHDIEILGQPGTVDFHPANGDSDLVVSAFRGGAVLAVTKARGLIELIKHYGLPLILIRLIFLGTVFELLRRLFRNVARGDSFSQNSIRLVQILSGVLIAFSFILSFADNLFAHAVLNYFSHNATITISGTTVQLPPTRHMRFMHGDGSLFFSGLLVLALSEVFRQGLALKRENELTI